MARPTKLTQEIIDRIANYLRAGAYVETAASACGVDKVTLHRWLKRGAEQKRGLHKALCNAIERAQSESEIRDLAFIDQGANGRGSATPFKDKDGNHIKDKDGNPMYLKPMEPDWRAAAWRLERRFQKRWGMKQTIEMSGPDGGPIQSLNNDQAIAEAQRILDRMKGRGSGNVGG